MIKMWIIFRLQHILDELEQISKSESAPPDVKKTLESAILDTRELISDISFEEIDNS